MKTPKEIIRIHSTYQTLSKKKKREVLLELLKWTIKELILTK